MWQPWRPCSNLISRRSSPFSCDESSGWLSLVAAPSGSASVWAETTLFLGSSQPMTEHSRGTSPGLFCQHRQTALWAIRVLDCIVRLRETSQSCTVVWSSFSQSPFLPPLLSWVPDRHLQSEGFPCLLPLPLPSTFHRHYLQQISGTFNFVLTSASWRT